MEVSKMGKLNVDLIERFKQGTSEAIAETPRKIDLLVGELQKEYTSADQNYQASSLFTSIGFMHRMELCRDLITKINELYKTDYKLK